MDKPMVSLGPKLIEEDCLEADFEHDSKLHEGYFKLKNCGDRYSTIATHLKEIITDNQLEYTRELGYFVGERWICILSWKTEEEHEIPF